MEKIFTHVVIGVLLTACSPGKQETAVADTTLVSMQDTIVNDQSVVSEEVVEETAAPLTAQTFESLPSELPEFMSAVQDMDKLAGWLMPLRVVT